MKQINSNDIMSFLDKYILINKTYSQVLDDIADRYPNQIFLKCSNSTYIKTYDEFRCDVNDFARGLISLGVRKDMKVAIWTYNVPEWFISFMASVKIGAIVVPLNTALKKDEVEFILKHSDTHTLIAMDGLFDSDHFGIINDLCPEISETKPGDTLMCNKLPDLKNVISIGSDVCGFIRFESVFERKNLVSYDTLLGFADNVSLDDVCNIQYTSGTTSFPKGVMLTHNNLVNNGNVFGDVLALSTEDRMLIHVPLFHCFGITLSFTAALTHGATIVPMPFFSAKESLKCISQEGITCMNGVPTMFIAMMNHPDYKKTNFSTMRTGAMAGTNCPPELMRKVAQDDEMHMYGIVCGYGRTESSPGCTVSLWNEDLDQRCTTVGHSSPYVECRIINPSNGCEVEVGENGEFCSRGYNTMKGYYKSPEETSKIIDKDGWLHSGDLAYIDANGYYHITGRISDMIIRGGENIYPSEIENILLGHPNIKDAQVFSVPDDFMGEEVACSIILDKDCSITKADIKEYLQNRISMHKIPKYYNFIDSFPLNASGKVIKNQLREKFLNTRKNDSTA